MRKLTRATSIYRIALSSVLLFYLHHSANAADVKTDSCNGRIIVKFKNVGRQTAQLNKRQSNQLQIANKNQPITHRRKLANGAHLLQRNTKNIQQSDADYIKELKRDSDVEYAECDARRQIQFVPNDPGFPGNPGFTNHQWYLNEAAGGIRAEQAWDISRNQSVSTPVIAIIDTGILPHEDLSNTRILLGYDFVSADQNGAFLMANDGDGRDNNPSDPGDWISQADINAGDTFVDCEEIDSSWHGTSIAGLIAAELDNNTGIAGIDHASQILPLRALGKCGGYTSDIADALRWAAGLHVDGVPDNANPADVINLSFGSEDPCSQTEEDAISAAVNAGALVVVSAGNEGTDIRDLAPANCPNVLTVTATTRQGGETCYTNIGPEADIAAPGGNTEHDTDPASNCTGTLADTLISISNSGLTTPNASTNTYANIVGSSFSAPMVSAAAGLIKTIDPSLTNIEIEALLVSSARSFPQGTTDSFGDCDTERCGKGILDINAALEAAMSAATENSGSETISSGHSSGGGNIDYFMLSYMFYLLCLRFRVGLTQSKPD